MLCLGRNGGHLTARNFGGFGGHAKTWGISDAIRAVHVENHVVDAITSLVKEAALEDEVDLVEGVRTILFSTKEEEAETRDEYDAAKAAGINVSVVEWLTKSEVEEVRQLICYHSRGTIIGFADVRSTISGSPPPRKHDMASQARHSPIQTRAECLASRVIEPTHAYARHGSQTITHRSR